MSIDLPGTIEVAIQHLREGAIQAADDLLANALNDYREQMRNIGQQVDLASKSKWELCVEFMTLVTSHLGNPDDLTALLNQINQPDEQ